MISDGYNDGESYNEEDQGSVEENNLLEFHEAGSEVTIVFEAEKNEIVFTNKTTGITKTAKINNLEKDAIK
jgi:hypothetical protein